MFTGAAAQKLHTEAARPAGGFLTSRPSRMALRSLSTTAGSVSGPCRNRQLQPTTSCREYPVMRQKASLQYTIGFSGRLGSLIVIPCGPKLRQSKPCHRQPCLKTASPLHSIGPLVCIQLSSNFRPVKHPLNMSLKAQPQHPSSRVPSSLRRTSRCFPRIPSFLSIPQARLQHPRSPASLRQVPSIPGPQHPSGKSPAFQVPSIPQARS